VQTSICTVPAVAQGVGVPCAILASRALQTPARPVGGSVPVRPCRLDQPFAAPAKPPRRGARPLPPYWGQGPRHRSLCRPYRASHVWPMMTWGVAARLGVWRRVAALKCGTGFPVLVLILVLLLAMWHGRPARD